MNVKLLTEHYLEFLSLKGGCPGSSESILVKLSHCWKSHVTAHLFFIIIKTVTLTDCQMYLLYKIKEKPHGLGVEYQILRFVAPQGRKTWLLFSVRDMSLGLRNPCFTKFSVANFL